MNKIEQLYKNRALNRGGIDFFNKSITLEIIEACKSENIKILGIDGFYLNENTTMPSLDDSADYSYVENDIVYDLAYSFVVNRNDNLYYEIVFD